MCIPVKLCYRRVNEDARDASHCISSDVVMNTWFLKLTAVYRHSFSGYIQKLSIHFCFIVNIIIYDIERHGIYHKHKSVDRFLIFFSLQ